MSKRRKLTLVALILNLVGLVLFGLYLTTSFGKVLLIVFICCMLGASALNPAAL